MTSTATAFPPSGRYIESIRKSCHASRLASGIKVKRNAVERLLLSPSFIDSFQRFSRSHGLAMPLQFPSLVEELNLIAVLSLLNFASGYRRVLHEQTNRGAWDNIRALVFSLYISASSGTATDFLSARGMQAITISSVAEQMRVDVHVERLHESIPGVTVGEVGGPMYELVQLITTTMNETGSVLAEMGYASLGMFVLEALKNGQKAAKGGDPDLDVVLEQIVKAIPAFRDMSTIDGKPVYCFKKALFMLCAIEIRFKSRSSEIPVPKTASLPVFSDNVLPSMLIHLGVLDISSSPHLSTLFPDHSSDLPKLLAKAKETKIVAAMPKEPPPDGPALTEKQAYILRAATIDACEIIVDIARGLEPAAADSAGVPASVLDWMRDLTLQDLDLWLWSVAKDRPDYRRLERFSLKNTVMY